MSSQPHPPHAIITSHVSQLDAHLVPIQGKTVRCEPRPQARAMECVSARQRLAPLEIHEADGAGWIVLQVFRGAVRESAHNI